ncbi:MAG TPA: diacylglycerol kinase family protein [Candidatus Acidoferrales bacterium]|nr:diacylglycerol kinase family protein [Candidatus Acidoferrales bacterium]
MSNAFLAVVNPAAGGGRCGQLAGPVLEKLRAAGIELEVVETHYPGQATDLAWEAYRDGVRRFLAVGGDGTAYEIVNGLFPEAADGSPDSGERPLLGFLPLGTGNSFLRDFTDRGADYSLEAILAKRERPCDVIRLTHREGVIHYINLLSVGFAADVAVVTNRRFKPFGPLGYLLGVLTCLVRLRRRPFPLRVDEAPEVDRRPCLFLSFNNSKFTGGRMKIAPRADTGDGLVEYVRWGPIGRLGLLANLHRLYDGTHLAHPLAERRAARRIDFHLDQPVDVMVDGEVLMLHCETLEVLPAALTVVV